MEDGCQSSVVFHSVCIKKNSSHGDDVDAEFTCNNYQPSSGDLIGIFDTGSDNSHDTPFVSKSISSLKTEGNLPTSVSLKIDFGLENGVFELRYIGAEKQVNLFLHFLWEITQC